jgi:hypothetical protein
VESDTIHRKKESAMTTFHADSEDNIIDRSGG